MTKVRQVRYVVIALNLCLVIGIGLAGFALARGPQHDPLGPFDATAYALEDHVVQTRDLSPVWIALDRPLDKVAPPPPPPIEPRETLTPPPALWLVALLPHAGDDLRSLAIVRGADGIQRLLKIGDEIQEGSERWRVAALRLKPQGEVTLGVLTLETDHRVQAYEAEFTSG